MDLLRFLLLLPVRAVRGLVRLLGCVLRPLVGSVTWRAPGWVGWSRHHPGRAGVVGLVAVVALACVGGGYWYQTRPRPVAPDAVTFEVKPPALTTYDTDENGRTEFTIHPLEVQFSDSVAPIERAGKPASGVHMSPDLKGEWSWADDQTLRFRPAVDWPVGGHVTVRFDAGAAFAPQVTVAEDRFDFDMPAFTAKSGDSEFHQDVENPAVKQAIFQVKFNYPVDPAEFEKRIGLALVGRDGKSETPLRHEVSYDAAKLSAWVKSQALAIPPDALTVRLAVDKGVRSAGGGAGAQDALRATVDVPGLYSLDASEIGPTLVDNERHEPDQVLMAQFSDGVRGADVAARAKAWVLPAHKLDVKTGVKARDDDPPYAWRLDEVSEAVLRQARPLPLDLVATEADFSPQQSFKFHAAPGASIYLRIDGAGLKSAGGYLRQGAVTRVFKVPPYPKLLRFMADGSLLALGGSKRVSVAARDLPGMALEIGRVLPDQLQHLVSMSYGSYAQPRLPYAFSADHIVERFVQKRAFPAIEPGKVRYEGIDLGQYLKSGKRGVFLLRLSSYDPVAERRQLARQKARAAQNSAAIGDDADDSSDDDDSANNDDNNDDNNDSSSDDSQISDTRLIVVTDLGMVVKRALDGSQDVFIASIREGRPVAGATVSVLAINGQALFTQTTGADGMAHFPAFKGLEREKQPTLYVVNKGEDLSFLPVSSYDRRLNFSRFDVDGERNATSQGQLSAYLFSDRGMYRPGDRMHIGLIVRAANWSRNPAGLPLQAEIVDPRGITVTRKPVAVDASGFAELDYTPAETAPTGAWTINLRLVKNGAQDDAAPLIGSVTVQVKEFMPDRLKVDARLSHQVTEGWVKPDDLKGLVDARNLFGTPAQERRVTATLTLRPGDLVFPSWRDYHFFDTRRAKDGYSAELEDGETDDQGHAEFPLDLKKYADATYQLYFVAKAYEAEGGRSVTAAARTLVSSNDWLVGYKSVDDLNYVKRDAPRAVRLVAIDPNAKATAVKDLRAQLVEQRYVSVLTRQDSGVYAYESRLKEVPMGDAQPLTIPAAGLDYRLRTDRPGSYALLIRRADGVEVNRVAYTVAGAANVTRSLDRNAELQISLNKSDYKPGEAVEVSIRAPYAGSGLITIERDKVYAHAWFHASTTSSVQRITVPAGMEGNGYINVQYMRDPASDEIFMSPLSYGVVPFSIDLDARRDALTVDAPALIKPGETATFTVHSEHPARVVVFAVDEGILQVARYQLGDPLQFFFRKRMLEVDTSQILDLILPEFDKLMSRAAAPGGDEDGGIGRQLNPFKRKHDLPVAYWSGILDVKGQAKVSYPVPDTFNGKLRVMAVAVSPDRVGTATSATTVRGDFVLSPNTPNTLAPGDEAQISVGVANNLSGAGDKPMPIAVALEAGPQLQVIGPATQNLTLAPGHEGVALFRVKATETLGSGALTFSARHEGKATRQRAEVSVRPAAPFRTQLEFATLAPGRTASVTKLRALYDAYAGRDASISTAPLVLAEGLAQYLFNFEHDCSEQLVSAMVPRFFAARWLSARVLTRATPNQFAPEGTTGPDLTARFFDLLRSRQNAQGGFGLWRATPDADPFVSAYAMHVLIDARARGVAVPRDMLDAGNAYLRQLAADGSLDDLDLLRQRAYAVYLLTRQGNVTTNDLAAVQQRLQSAFPKEWKNDLAAAWLAASYQLLKQDKEAAALIAGPQKLLERKPSAREDFTTFGYYMDPLTRDATVLYLLARHFPDRIGKLSPNALANVGAPLEQGNFNTLSSAMTILALDAYSSATASGLDKLAIDAVDAQGARRDISTVQAGLMRTATWGAGTQKLDFVNNGALPAWWLVSQSGYDRSISTQTLKNGLEIVREYTDAKGKPLNRDKIAPGQEIEVHLKIRATGKDTLSDVAIVDLLPGGFDPVQTPQPSAPASSAASADTPDDDDGDRPTPWRSPVSTEGTTWQIDYAEVREDRVVIYGSVGPSVSQFVYRIKASNAGRFVAPPAYGEAMYDRRIQAQAPGGATLTVIGAPSTSAP